MKRAFLLSLITISLYASFSGNILDIKTKKPIKDASIFNKDSSLVKSDENGSFVVDENSTYFIKAYGYRPFKFKTDTNNTTFYLEPIKVKALYLSFWHASNESKKLKNIIDIIKNTELNSIVVDVKNEYGYTSFKTNFKEANLYGAYKKRTNKNIKKFMSLMKKNNIYTIARIVTFKDELQAVNNPEYALKDKNGVIWRNRDKMAWVDPFNKKSHNYTIEIAKEAAKVGFDEINFDYIRFPAKKSLKFSKENNITNRVFTIEEFLKTAQKELKEYGSFISVDTYGNVCWSKYDCNIGQTIESLAKYADYIYPMLYPSGFSKGSFHVEYPSEYPYKVVYKSIANIQNKIDLIRVRPWLQHFKDYAHLRKQYKKDEINAQIKATNDLNTGGWLLWSPSSTYFKEYFKKTN